ncbi:MAG: mercury methylation ferredoxin HgcB [Bacillota bacterium]|nr:mercury methylation ferredoxin HgcB [Bacillota bacterium]
MKLIYLKNVSTLSLNQERCIGCGMCTNVCPHEVFSIVNRKAHIKAKDSCMECSACVKNCPYEALTVASGVGCAAAIINSMITGGPVECGCSSDND